jgi:hypothetical protein
VAEQCAAGAKEDMGFEWQALAGVRQTPRRTMQQPWLLNMVLTGLPWPAGVL